MSIIRLPLFLFLFYTLVVHSPMAAGAANDSNCVSFEYPVLGAVIKSSACTVLVKTCPSIESVKLSAHCRQDNGLSDTILDLGTIDQPPFQWIWNIADVPNQLIGMGFTAKGRLKNGSTIVMKQEGVFLYNKPAPYKSLNVSGSTVRASLLWCDTLRLTKAPIILRISGGANAKEMRLTVLVADPLFSVASTNEKQPDARVEALVDWRRTREPLPSEKTLIIVVPLNKKPMLLSYNKIDAGKNPAGFAVDTAQYGFPTKVKMVDGKGYRIDIRIPSRLLGGVMPDSFYCNVVATINDSEGKSIAVAMNGATGAAAYCPLTWATLHRLQAGPLNDARSSFLLSFCAGIIITLALGLPLAARRRRAFVANLSRLSEEEKRKAQGTYQLIEQRITQKKLSLRGVAKSLSLSGWKIEALLKKFSGQSFKKFVMASRVELAKERLRCSHASERAIADSCGFKNVDEMKKYFLKRCGTTPKKYRRDNQVA
jgi:AraC-like DNA-binding protein